MATTSAAAPTGDKVTVDRSLSLPADVRVDFDWTLPADAAQAAALTVTANYMQSMAHGVTRQNVQDPVLAAYSTGDALSSAHSYIKQYVDHKWTLTGTDRYYAAKVRYGSSKKVAQVTFCEDQSKFFGKETATHKVLTNAPSDDSYVTYTVVLAQAPTKTLFWQAQSLTSKAKALECKQ